MIIASLLGCMAVFGGMRLGEGFKFQGSKLGSFPSYSEVVVLSHLTMVDDSMRGDSVKFKPLLKAVSSEKVTWILGTMTSKYSPLIAISQPSHMKKIDEVQTRHFPEDLIGLLDQATGSFIMGCLQHHTTKPRSDKSPVEVDLKGYADWKEDFNASGGKALPNGCKFNEGGYAIGSRSLGYSQLTLQGGSADDTKLVEKKKKNKILQPGLRVEISCTVRLRQTYLTCRVNSKFKMARINTQSTLFQWSGFYDIFCATGRVLDDLPEN